MKKHEACYWLHIQMQGLDNVIAYHAKEAERFKAEFDPLQTEAERKEAGKKLQYHAQEIETTRLKREALEVAACSLTSDYRVVDLLRPSMN